jgi:putative tryptophan/tyrosine transport system substrate-binding protein
MRRRDVIVLISGTGVWPLMVRAQQGERLPRIGILLPALVNDPQWHARFEAFLNAFARLGWIAGRNVRIETRWATTDAAEIRRQASELAAIAPDVILAVGTSTVGPLLQATRTVPIVFSVVIINGVEIGYIGSLARPGGNATGFMNLEYGMGAKCLELLKEIAPTVTRVAMLRDFLDSSQTAQFGDVQTLAPALRVEVIAVNIHTPVRLTNPSRLSRVLRMAVYS